MTSAQQLIPVLSTPMFVATDNREHEHGKANFAQFEGNHCAFLFIQTYNSEILCKFAKDKLHSAI